MLPIRVVLADLQGHHGWKALAILRMASLQFLGAVAFITHGYDYHRGKYIFHLITNQANCFQEGCRLRDILYASAR
jgi:hypothetical protein